MRTNFPLTVSFLLLAACSFAQDLNQKIATAYTRFEQDSQLQFGTASLTVLNAKTGEVVFSKNGSVGLASASTLKTITSATAYYLLGADFTFKTNLAYSGAISKDGTLNGNLVIIGGGDPSLGSWRYQQTKEQVVLDHFVTAIRKSGIRKIKGSVIADDRLFGTQTLPTGWIWQDIGNYYGAGPSSLTWRENQFDLIFKAGDKPGAPAIIQRTEPEMPGLKIINEVTTGKAGSGDNTYAYSAPYTDIIYVRGTYGIDLKKKISISVPDPALEAATRLRDTLNALGIVVSTNSSTYRILDIQDQKPAPISAMIDSIASPPLSQLVYWFNQKSINLYGEHLVKAIALKQGKQVSTANGAEAVIDFWNKKLGINKNALNIIDGSGLSPGTRVTTVAMATILQSVKKETWFDSYYESLPVYNNMKMKSGSINDVLAYTGYQTTSTGVDLVFSFIVNNYNDSSSAVKKKMFEVLDTLK